jgi:hypothetical protein
MSAECHNVLARHTLSVAKTTLVTFSLTADLATLVNRAITSYFLFISTLDRRWTYLSRPSAAVCSNESCHRHVIAQYWDWGFGLDLSDLINLLDQLISATKDGQLTQRYNAPPSILPIGIVCFPIQHLGLAQRLPIGAVECH